MKWLVVDAMGHAVPGEGVYLNPRSALYAATIHNAHELKNDRAAGYRVDPPVDPIPLHQLDLPRWASEVYEKLQREVDAVDKAQELGVVKMLPGQEPYTPAEQAKLSGLLPAACDAEDEFSDDELEMFAATKRGA